MGNNVTEKHTPSSDEGSTLLQNSEMLAPTYHTTWCHNPEKHNMNPHDHKNLRSRNFVCENE
jgi:hypothetical protein